MCATEQHLLTRAREGDFEAFDQLVQLHEGRVYWTAMQILRQREDAEDVVQTSFIRALEHLDSFREDAAFATWLHRIAVNTALKTLRKRKGLSTVPLGGPESEDGTVPHPHYVAEWNLPPQRLLEREELRDLLDTAIAELPEKHRLVFVLRDVEELSVAETAEALGISEANVKVRLLRARLALREALTKVFGDDAHRLARHPAEEGATETDAEAILKSYLTR